jgi:type IV secretory pathway VirB2 component (pilin)
MAMDEERLLEYALAIVAIAIIGAMAIAGVINPREAISYILTIIGYVLGKNIVAQVYRTYKSKRAYPL